MKRKFLQLCFFVVIFLISSIKITNSQVSKQVTLWCTDDTSIGGEAGFEKIGLGHSFANIIVTYDTDKGFGGTPVESWLRFDLNSLADSIAEGEKILYAEIFFKVAANSSTQGIKMYHLFNADDWEGGDGSWDSKGVYEDNTGKGLTYADALTNFDFLNEDNYNLIVSDEEVGGTSAKPSYNVTDAVNYEMTEGNKILTLRLAPTVPVDQYDGSDTYWLGLYSLESTFDLAETDPFNKFAPFITFSIGPEQPTQFSDLGDFGDNSNFETIPDKFGYWMVSQDEGDNRFALVQQTAPINKTPGGVAVYNAQSFGDFDFSVNAKVNNILKSEKTDLILVFGYQDAQNYLYAMLSGNDECGFYKVTPDGKQEITLVGTPALQDTAYNSYNLVREGNKVTIKINGQDYFSYDNAAFGVEGKIGFGSYNDIVFFDDFIQGTVETNFDALNATIAEAKAKIDAAVVGVDYSQEVIDALSAAITAAEAITGNSDAAQADVNTADVSLKAAIQAFIENPLGVYTGNLSAAIDEAQTKVNAAIEGLEGGQYDEGAKAVFQEAINAAKAILQNAEATQEQVDTAKSDLDAAEDMFDAEINNVGIETASAVDYKIYPIPVKNVLNIHHESKEINKISIFDVTGQKVIAREHLSSSVNQINTSSLKTGMYIVQIYHNDGTLYTSKVVKR